MEGLGYVVMSGEETFRGATTVASQFFISESDAISIVWRKEGGKDALKDLKMF